MNRYTNRGLELYGLVVLLCTTLLWAILGAVLQTSNADQLVDSYLFENWQTFNGSSFPNQHTFFLKWPLFLLHSIIGLNQTSFIVLTILIAVATVGSIAYLLSRIERRPNVRGALYLAMASVLLMVPPVPYAGALLPTNFAMLTTRNVEYVVYICALVLLTKSRLFTKWHIIAGFTLMTLLFVSDGLFPPLSIGGALLLLAVAVLRKRQAIRVFALRWLGVSVVAYLISSAILKSAELLFPGRLVGKEAPYAFIASTHDAVLALSYGLLGLLTNFGANPAYAAKTVGEIPHSLMHEMSGFKLGAYIVNSLLFCLGILAMYAVVKRSLRQQLVDEKHRREPVPIALLLSLALIATTIVAFISFVTTKHYYLVDSRYLAIFFFSVIVSMAVYARSISINSIHLKTAVIVCSMAILGSSYGIVQTYREYREAQSSTNRRTDAIVKRLQNRNTAVLVGDYWRVMPVRLASHNQQLVLPLADCTTPRNVLTSKSWQPNLKTTSFAYLLTLDGSATDYPACNLQQVIAAYGKPTERQILAGDSGRPKELLLFYDR